MATTAPPAAPSDTPSSSSSGASRAGQRGLNDPRVQQLIRQGLHDNHAQLLQNAYFEVLHDEAKVRNYFAEQILKQGAQ